MGRRRYGREAAIYRELIGPLGVRAPRVFGWCEDAGGGVLLMEDAGAANLEQQPRAEHFAEAARELARLRGTAAAALARGAVPPAVRAARTVPAAALGELLRAERLPGRDALLRAQAWLPGQLARLDREVPLTLVHHDYHAKNLVVQADGRVLPIDWSNAYLSPHLGDLYCLLNEAHARGGVADDAILAAYLSELQQGTEAVADGDHGETLHMEQRNATRLHADSPLAMRRHVEWQLIVGGLCWLIRSLRWLVYGGTDMIPGSEAWVPDLLADMAKLLDRHESGVQREDC